MRERMVRNFVTRVAQARTPRRVGGEPVADDERRDHGVPRCEHIEQLRRQVEVAVSVERQRDPVARVGTTVDERSR